MLKTIFSTLLISAVVIILLSYIFQRHLIYFPDKHKPRLQDYNATDMCLVKLRTKDNIELSSWYKSAKQNQPTLLFLHGNAGNIGYRMPLIRKFIKAGFGVFLLEYRGYGGNKGSPTEQGLYEDGQTALTFLYKKGIKPQKIILYGESLGTGIATKLAAENPIACIILQSPFTSLANLARFHYPWSIIKPWDKYSSIKRMKQIHAPLLVVHGKKDNIVPFTEGLAIFNEANNPKDIFVFDEKNHNDLWDAHDFFEKIIKFSYEYCT